MGAWFQNYAKELVSLTVPFVAWFLANFLKGKARVEYSAPHKFTFLVQQPLRNERGEEIQPNQLVHTQSFIFRNSGREYATRLEIVFNNEPMCLNVWPPRHFDTHTEIDKRYVMIFDSLSPGEVIGCEILSINRELPPLLTVRSDQSVARHLRMLPQPVIGNGVRMLVTILIGLGLATAIYLTMLAAQFLILSTPYGH